MTRQQPEQYRKAGESSPKPKFSKLTNREAVVVMYIARSMSNKEIADVMGLSHKTIEKFRDGAMAKCCVNDVVSLVRHAIVCGLIRVEDFLAVKRYTPRRLTQSERAKMRLSQKNVCVSRSSSAQPYCAAAP